MLVEDNIKINHIQPGIRCQLDIEGEYSKVTYLLWTCASNMIVLVSCQGAYRMIYDTQTENVHQHISIMLGRHIEKSHTV